VTSSVGTTTPSLTIPIIVKGLTNGNSYVFSAKAINAVGSSNPSVAPGQVVPGLVRNYGYDATAYQTIDSAYKADTHTSEIEIQAGTTVGSFVKGDSDTVVVRGGFDAAFSLSDGQPSILGKVTLSGGKSSFQNLVIRAPAP
jgi:hypothetical protein